MARIDPQYAQLHKEIYERCLDELDNDIIKIIMSTPHSEEAALLNARVESELHRHIESTISPAF